MFKFKIKFNKFYKAFTLTELLVVMAIMGFLMSMSVVGIQYALKKSRDTQRQNLATGFNNALNAYYSSQQKYPSFPTGYTSGTCNKKCIELLSTGAFDSTTGNGALTDYLEGNFDLNVIKDTTGESISYVSDAEGLNSAICIATEDAGSLPMNISNKYKGCFCQGSMKNTAQKDCGGLLKTK